MHGIHRLPIAALLLSGLALAPAFAATVSQKSRSFRPGEISIARGETVTFTNEDSYIHQGYVSGLFEPEKRARGENLNQPFQNSGTFQVACRIPPPMKLPVRVR